MFPGKRRQEAVTSLAGGGGLGLARRTHGQTAEGSRSTLPPLHSVVFWTLTCPAQAVSVTRWPPFLPITRLLSPAPPPPAGGGDGEEFA